MVSDVLIDVNEETIESSKKCAILTKVTTPNKAFVPCDYPVEGRYLTLVKNETDSILTFNEVHPLLLGKPLAFASSYASDFHPMNVLQEESGVFKSVEERFPWIVVDFEEARTIEAVLLKTKDQKTLSNVQIRVGHEKIAVFSQPLSDRNALCSNFDTLVSENKSFQIECNETLKGRFLSIQLMSFGSLEFEKVIAFPLSVDGGLDEDEPWSLCSKTCDNGTSFRHLPCTKPEPFNGGKPCLNNRTREEACNQVPCPSKSIISKAHSFHVESLLPSVHGDFTPWSEWTTCSRTCGVGVRKRHRTCSNPEPEFNGLPCFGLTQESKSCGNPEEKCCSFGCCSGNYIKSRVILMLNTVFRILFTGRKRRNVAQGDKKFTFSILLR